MFSKPNESTLVALPSSFNTITQYDKQFDSLFANPNKKGFSCSFFSLITAWKFLNGVTPTQISHEETIGQSLMAQSLCDVSFGVTFEEMLSSYTDINPTQIMATAVELINSGELGFEQILPIVLDDARCVVLILKNERYLTVLIDKNGYYFRDCHENIQFNFSTLDELVIHLINTYQFTESIDLGLDYSAYSSIEFLTINTTFFLQVAEMVGLSHDSVIADVGNMSENVAHTDTSDNTLDEMCYLQMLSEEINKNQDQIATNECDIDIDQIGDFSGNNDIDDLDESNDYVDF
jgi:hypothetical protein